MNRIIFHIDCNNAFLSWSAIKLLEDGYKVDIRNIYAVIGGDEERRTGIVLAKSNLCKKLGIKTADTLYSARKKCKNLKVFPPNYKFYAKKSNELFNLLNNYSPDIEVASIDECYLDYTKVKNLYGDEVKFAYKLKNEIKEKLGFTVNIGLSTNKLLAKMASDFEKPNKVHTLFPEEVPAKMWPLPIGELFMAGCSSVETMKKLEIYTIGDLANTDPAILELHLKSHGRKLWEFANGLDDSEVESVRAEAKGVGNSTTLPKDLITEAEALPVLKDLAVSVGRRLRKAGQKAGMVSVEIKYHTFNQVSHQKQMERQSNQDQDIYQASIELFRELWSGEPIRLLGIRTSKLSEESEPEQLSLFDMKFESEETRKKKKNLKEALKKLEGKYGDGIVKKGW